MKKTWLSAVMAMTMAVCGLASCQSGSTTSGSQSSTASTQQSEASAVQSTAAGEENSSAAQANGQASWSAKKDTPITLNWFVAFDWYQLNYDPKINENAKQLLEETGITINFESGDMEKLNALIKTDKLPDIITVDNNETVRLQLENYDKALPLEELISKHAPDIVYPKSMQEWMKNDNGHWYSYVNFYYGQDNVSENKGYFETHNQNFARKDLLDQIGMTLEDMRTKDGFLKALRAVKEKKLSYDGKEVIPYMGLFSDKLDRYMAYQLGAIEEDEKGNFVPVYKTPQYEEALLLFNQMYREGLLTDESFSAKRETIGQKVASGQLFATTMWTNVSGDTYRQALYQRDPQALMFYAGAIKGDSRDQVAVPAKSNGGWTSTLITKNCKDPERAIQLFSWLSQKKNQLDGNCGVGQYDIKDGHIVMKEAAEKLKAENQKEYSMKYSGIDWLVDYTFYQGLYPKPNNVLDEDSIRRTEDKQVLIYDDKAFTATVPAGGSDAGMILTRVEQYKDQQLVKVVTAASEEEAKANLKAMLDEMDKLGLPQLTEIQNEMFQKNKQKLNMKFASPFNK